MAYIELEHLNKVIKGNTVLDDLNLALERNKIYGFIGRNGSGKTMLFRVLAGLVRPTSGVVRIDGKQLGQEISFPESLGLLIENIGLWDWYSGTENLRMLTRLGKKVDAAQIEATIRRVGLDPADKRPVRKYSLGMKQRIVLAQALLEQPDLLILDEPTNALDEKGVEALRQILLEEKARGATILIASHNKDDIEILCDAIYRMDNGAIIETTERAETNEK